MMRFLVLLLLLSACTADISMKNIRMDSLLNDNSSKIWLVDKVLLEGENISPMRTAFKDVFIFYKSGRVCIQPLNSLGNKEGDYGYFFLNDENTELKIQFKKDNWMFEIKQLEIDRIILKAKEGSLNAYDLELIPLPEL